MSILLTLRVLLLLCLASTALCITDKSAIRNFPLGLNCNSGLDEAASHRPADNDTVQCTIRVENEVLFNKSITWKNRKDNGSMDADERFNNKVLSISVAWTNHTNTLQYKMAIKEPTVFNCSLNVLKMDFKSIEGESEMMSFKAPVELTGDMSLEQYSDIETIWYRGCDEIERDNPGYAYVEGYYSTSTRRWWQPAKQYKKLSVKRSTLESSPGVYHSVLRYKGFTTYVASQKFCVQTNHAIGSERVVVRGNSSSFLAQSGDDLVIGCFVNTNEDRRVGWEKFNKSSNKFDEICEANGDTISDVCVYESPPLVCEAVSAEEIAKIRRRNGSSVSTLTLRDLSHADSGRYRCRVIVSDTWPEFQFSVTVQDHVKVHNQLTIVLSVVAGILFVLLMLLLAYRWKRIEFQYFVASMFTGVKESDKMITFLVYSDDAFGDKKGSNPVSDVTCWLKSKNHNYHDPNDGTTLNDAGTNIADHTLQVLDNCLSLTVFLTQKLFAGDNLMEIFKIFRGFEDNVQTRLPIVFVCTKLMEKEIHKNSRVRDNNNDEGEEKYIDQDIFITFSRFMKRNTVVHWKAGGKTKFNRALYVAMPKVKRAKISEVYSNGMVTENIAHETPRSSLEWQKENSC